MLTGETFVDPAEMPFSRRGSYICFANSISGINEFGKTQLWIANARQRPTDRNRSSIFSDNHFRQIRLELVRDGLPLQSVISTTPYELTLSCDFGSVRFCIGDVRYAQCKGSDGLSLRITAPTGMIGPIKTYAAFDLLDGSWKTNFGNYSMLFVPIKGMLKQGPEGSIELVPDSRGEVEMVMEECVSEPKRRPSYLSYEEGLACVKADFDEFAQSLDPPFTEKYAERGRQALWTLWGLTSVPMEGSVYKRQMVRMNRSSFDSAFSWQQAMQAIFLACNADFSWEVLLSCFDNQSASGRIADAVTYIGPGDTAKPPLQGVALLWIMEHGDISGRPKEDLEFLFDGMERWTNYHLTYRDLDNDGIFENQHAGETGWESCSFYRIGFPQASPDMNAYLALQEEALARLGRLIGRSEDVCAYWENKSKETIAKIIEMFWTDEGWTAVNIVTKERGGTTSLIPSCVLVLGNRLPREIIDRSISLIFDRPGFVTPYGLASEKLSSPYFRHGWCSGSITTPVQALMVIALENCGRPDLARRVAISYIDTLSRNGLVHIHDPFNGYMENGSLGMGGEAKMFNSGWTAGCYIFFAERYGLTHAGSDLKTEGWSMS